MQSFPELMASDPQLMQMMQNPKVMGALATANNPAALKESMKDPEVAAAMDLLQSKMASMGMMGKGKGKGKGGSMGKDGTKGSRYT